jgi:hypothetical protein
MARNTSGCRACGTTRSSRFRAYEPVVHDVLFKEKGPTKPSSLVLCNSCYASCAASASSSIHEVHIFRHYHNLLLYIGYFLCWFQLVLTACCISRQLRQMRQPRKVTTRKPSTAATRILVTTMMEIMFLWCLLNFELKRQDLVDFVVRSASFAELALRVNFIITVINEDISEKLGSFLMQALQSSASDATVINTKSQRLIRPKKSTSFRYYKIYPIIHMNPDPIRC